MPLIYSSISSYFMCPHPSSLSVDVRFQNFLLQLGSSPSKYNTELPFRIGRSKYYTILSFIDNKVIYPETDTCVLLPPKADWFKEVPLSTHRQNIDELILHLASKDNFETLTGDKIIIPENTLYDLEKKLIFDKDVKNINLDESIISKNS